MPITDFGRRGKLIETRLRSIERLNNSTNGNPRFRLHTDEGVFTTQTDAAPNGQVENHRRCCVDNRVLLTASPADRVWDWLCLPDRTDRSDWVTEQVALWVANDYDCLPIRDSARGLFMSSMRRQVLSVLRGRYGPRALVDNLARNDYDRIDWAEVALELQEG